ncbi:MAG: hypothetical protein HFF10_05180 [Angelakisella sp.]|jgi:hypothetical protein|nr:hypothetical protein [Angelakisella sp.]
MKRIICITIALLLTLLVAAACGPKEEGVTFTALVEEVGEGSLLVVADEDSGVRRSADRFSVGLTGAKIVDEEGKALEAGDLWLHDWVEITFDGNIAESSPAQITATRVARLVKEQLTQERVKELAKKGDSLAWEDFYPYRGDDVGSGLMILRYKLAEGGALWVGGTPAEKPWYIRLTKGDTTIDEAYIDIRENDVEEFLSSDGSIPQEGARDTSETAQAGDYPAAIQIEGRIYLLAEAPMPAEIEESAIIGRTTSYTDSWPQQDGETNFSRELDLPYARVEGGMAVLLDHEWYFCEPAAD